MAEYKKRKFAHSMGYIEASRNNFFMSIDHVSAV